MKLYILKARDDAEPWSPWFDKTFGMVIRAESEERARTIAAENCSEEGRGAWLDSENSTCEELTGDGEEEVIISDERWA